MSPAHPLIVAGYDGSAASRLAVEKAIERTGPAGHLIIVHAYLVPADYIGESYYQDMLDVAVQNARSVMDGLTDQIPGLAAVDWEPDVIAGHADDAITRVASLRGADEIVIGSRGQGRLRAVLGSVSLGVLHQASCPVLVIPARLAEKPAAEASAAESVA